MTRHIGTIGRKVLTLSLASALIPLIIAVGVGIKYGYSTIQRQTLTTLEVIADGTEREISGYINKLKGRTLDFSSDGYIKDAVEKINNKDQASDQITHTLNNHLALNKRPIIPEGVETFVLSREGVVIASSDPSQIGSNHSKTGYFQQGLDGVYVSDVFLSPQDQQPTMVVSAPLTGMASGSPVGVIANRINPNIFNHITTGDMRYARYGGGNFKRIGATGETYLVNRDRLMLTESRLFRDVILKQVVDTAPVRLALKRGDVMRGGYPDYRGVSVIGASRIIAETGWVVLAEIGRDEALTPLRGFVITAAISGGLLAAIFALLAFIFSGRIVRPIASLAEAAGQITGGNWEACVMARGKDEVARLADVFNTMMAVLRKGRDELESLVEERTAELSKTNAILIGEIAEHKRAEERASESEERFAGLVDVAEDAIVSIDEAQRIILFNKGAERAFGYARNEAIGQPLEILIPERFRIAHRDHVIQFANSQIDARRMGERGYEIFGIRKDGKEFPSDATIAKLQVGDKLICTVIARDVTERKQMEEALKESVKALKRSNIDLEQFAYVASHDLQEPLRMVASYVQLLERRYKGKLDADADEFIGYAVSGVTRMKGLINDLLTYSRATTRGKELKPIDCSHIIGHVIKGLKLAIEEGGAVITYDPMPTLIADHVQMEQVFQNLIGNAIKFRGNEAPRIHVSARQEGNEWLFAVRDNGIGIDPQYAERIFVIFQRLHGKKDYPGSGIGLSIAKKIVERHGGRIWVESQPGNGATFYFTIPAADPRMVTQASLLV